MNLNSKLEDFIEKYFPSIKNSSLRNIILKIIPFLIPLGIALYLYNPFDNVFSFYWDQTILLQDKSIFTSSFYLFQERFGFGVYGYYINYIVYSIFNLIFGPEKGIDIMMIALVQTAFWGTFLFIKEITRNISNFNVYLVALIYIISIEAQMNVYRTIIGQNFLWGFLPLTCYFTLKVIKENSIKWKFALAFTLLFLQVSFAHPTSIINYALVIGLTMLLSIVSTKFNLSKIIKIAVINIFVFLPILFQILLVNREVAGFIYNSSNAFSEGFVLSWYELGVGRFELRNILRLDYFLESQIRSETFNQESLVRIANTQISDIFNIYSWLSFINLGFFIIIFLPILQFGNIFSKSLKQKLVSPNKKLSIKYFLKYFTNLNFNFFKPNNKKKEKLLLAKNKLQAKLGDDKIINKEVYTIGIFEKGILENENNKAVLTYTITALIAMLGVGILAMFQGPLLQLFGLIFKIVPSVFLLYRYLDAKFGVIFILFILLAISAAYNVIKSKKVKIAINVFLIFINIFYLGFFSTKYFISPYSQVEIPSEYSETCTYLKNNSFRTIKFPYSYDFLHFTNVSDKQVLSNDIFNQNCEHSLLSIRTLPSGDETEIIKIYDLMVTSPDQFKQRMVDLSIDTIIVDKQFIPNYSWYRISTESEKSTLINQIDTNYSQNKAYENKYFAVYEFKPASPFYLSNGNIAFNKANSTHYDLKINNITSDTTLEFQYTFGSWNLTKPNTKYLLPDNLFSHYKGRGFNNSWSINYSSLNQNCPNSYCQKNEDGSYNLSLQLWYKPQVIFEEFMIIYIVILSSMVLYKFKNKPYDQTK